MLAGSQLGVTVASLLLGRIGESAVASLLRSAFGLTSDGSRRYCTPCRS